MLTPHGPGPILMNKDQLTNIAHVGHPNDFAWRWKPPMVPPPLPPIRLQPLPLPDFRLPRF